MTKRKRSRKGWTLFCKTPIKFPDTCARCGADTDRTITVKVRSGEPGLKPTALLGHVGHVIEGLRELHSGSTRIPCCQRCQRYFLIGRWMSVAFLICTPAMLFFIVRYASTWPEWLMVLAGFSAFSMFLGSLIPYMVGQGKSAPVTIWRERDGYYYHFYSGAYSDWADKQSLVSVAQSNVSK